MTISKKLELKGVPIIDLVPYAKNPRKNDAAVNQIAASLKEYGLVKNSIVVDEDMVLITGHTTVKAMKQLEWSTAPEVTQVFGLTPAQKKAYRIADNKYGEIAEWDIDLLALEFDEMRDMDFDIQLTGFMPDDIDSFFAQTEQVNQDTEPLELNTPAAPVKDTTHKTYHCPKCGFEFLAE